MLLLGTRILELLINWLLLPLSSQMCVSVFVCACVYGALGEESYRRHIEDSSRMSLRPHPQRATISSIHLSFPPPQQETGSLCL